MLVFLLRFLYLYDKDCTIHRVELMRILKSLRRRCIPLIHSYLYLCRSREIISSLHYEKRSPLPHVNNSPSSPLPPPPIYDPEELLGIATFDVRFPYDMRGTLMLMELKSSTQIANEMYEIILLIFVINIVYY